MRFVLGLRCPTTAVRIAAYAVHHLWPRSVSMRNRCLHYQEVLHLLSEARCSTIHGVLLYLDEGRCHSDELFLQGIRDTFRGTSHLTRHTSLFTHLCLDNRGAERVARSDENVLQGCLSRCVGGLISLQRKRKRFAPTRVVAIALVGQKPPP